MVFSGLNNLADQARVQLGRGWVILIIAPVFLGVLFIVFRLAKGLESSRHKELERHRPHIQNDKESNPDAVGSQSEPSQKTE